MEGWIMIQGWRYRFVSSGGEVHAQLAGLALSPRLPQASLSKVPHLCV
jgi:hypothetical protein